MAEVLNEDIPRFHNRINRMIEELQLSVSAGISEFRGFEMIRLRSYISALRFMHDVVQAMPELDMPETHPKPYTLRANPVVEEKESEIINDLVNMLVNIRGELNSSQSAARMSGLITYDSARFLAGLDKLELYLTNYVEKATPLDLPESSPRAGRVKEGRTGLAPTA